MRPTVILLCSVILIAFVIDFAYSQDRTPNSGNPNTDIASASDTNANPPAIPNGTGSRSAPARPPTSKPKPPRRRRPLRRRRKKFGRGRRNRKKTTTPPMKTTTPPGVFPDTGGGGTANDVSIKGTSALKSNPNVVNPVNNRNVANTVNKPRNKPQKKKPAASAVDDFLEEDFFKMFITTTEPTNKNASPPPFDPNAKPGEKTMPVVDTLNSLAHDGQPCNATYKPHDTIQTKYMMKYAEGVWETLNCPPNLGTGLVWRQDLCACGEKLVPIDPDDYCARDGFYPDPENKFNYIRRHHGANAIMNCNSNLVWSQKKCQCLFDTTPSERPMEERVTFQCKTILHLKFEGNLTNTADGYQIQLVRLDRRGRLPRIRYMKARGAKDKAALVVSQPLEFQAYRGNDFQTQVTYSINFKVSPNHRRRNNFMTLLTDECIGHFGGGNKERRPSFSLTFQSTTKTFRLQFRTEMADVDRLVTGAKPDNDGWYKTVVYFEDATVNLENNGKKLLSVKDIYGKVPQNKCPLFIAGRGPGFDRSQDFYGYMDNVFLVKDCKFHEANIKFL